MSALLTNENGCRWPAQASCFAPTAHFDTIGLDQANDALVRWGHKMGAWRRPTFRRWCHGLFVNGELVAVAIAGDLIRRRVAGFERHEALELGRLCASRPKLCRIILRLWRELVFPGLCATYGWSWVVSYQDRQEHTGDLYRGDGWACIARSRSGTDARSGAIGRDKNIWAWSLAGEPRRRWRERQAAVVPEAA